MMEFLAMNGYAAFVWGSYGLTFAVVAILIVFTLKARHAAKARLERIQALNARESLKTAPELPRGDPPEQPGTGATL